MTSFQHFGKNRFSTNGTERNWTERNKRNATEGSDILNILKKVEVPKATWQQVQTGSRRNGTESNGT